MRNATLRALVLCIGALVPSLALADLGGLTGGVQEVLTGDQSVSAPELDPAGAAAAIALLSSLVLLQRDRDSRKR